MYTKENVLEIFEDTNKDDFIKLLEITSIAF